MVVSGRVTGFYIVQRKWKLRLRNKRKDLNYKLGKTKNKKQLMKRNKQTNQINRVIT